jgi:hypothetical protein
MCYVQAVEDHAFGADGIAMILRGDIASAGILVENPVIAASVAILEFECTAA